MSVRLALAVALLAGCGSKTYECTASSQCVKGGVDGICAQGYCAFPDPACEGGHRYEDNAGGGLAGTCTPSIVDAAIDAPAPTLCIADVGFGRRFGCVLKQAGTVWCGGANESGQLGNNTAVQSAAAVQVLKASDNMPLTGAVSVALGFNHSCARLAGGEVWCWGANNENQLGDGTTTTRTRAAPVLAAAMGAPLSGALELGVGAGTGCVRKAADEFWCWGKNNDGEIGDNSATHRAVPVRSGDATAFALSLWGTCRVNPDTSISCHGWNRGAMFSLDKEEGYNQPMNYLVPTQALGAGGTPITGAKKVAMGSGLCAVMTDGGVLCSGDGQYGQNGTGQSRRVLSPVRRANGTPLTGVDRLVAKWPHVCARLSTGAWECWGRGSEGEFGDGTFGNRGFATPLTASCP